MTIGSISQYTEPVQGRYPQTSKREKGRILDELAKVADCHRKAATRLLHRGNHAGANKKHGRPRQYGTAPLKH